ncbi:Protein dead ringer [Eufriesea mexicana]|uniref:Protein dead ringer n=1 Tax=Eufriesea mexicana TaxID=516756 RepID=A0A310SUK6_9HYME|nr:Protein dead ringer [Eufriesea mexicana]
MRRDPGEPLDEEDFWEEIDAIVMGKGRNGLYPSIGLLPSGTPRFLPLFVSPRAAPMSFYRVYDLVEQMYEPSVDVARVGRAIEAWAHPGRRCSTSSVARERRKKTWKNDWQRNDRTKTDEVELFLRVPRPDYDRVLSISCPGLLIHVARKHPACAGLVTRFVRVEETAFGTDTNFGDGQNNASPQLEPDLRTPINRLPIMAKSVLDLYELYNLVIARGGLVDVINKKLWQEIIKGLHLPSSITSAAFTLRTQYMKYLYPYECEKRRLSTPAELQAAIDGNRREGRRSSYGAYAASGGAAGESLVQRNPHTPNSLALHAQMTPLSLVTAVAAGGQHHGPQSLVNGSAAHTPLPHHPHHPQHPQGLPGQPPNAGPIPGMAPSEFEARMVEYVKLLNKELRSAGAGTPPPMIHRQGSASPPSSTPPRDGAFSALEMSRLTLWNMYNNNTLYPGVGHQPPMSPQASHSPVPPASSPEPQREALDLGLRSSPVSSSPARQSSPSSGGSMQVKRDPDLTGTPGPPPAKRLLSDDDSPIEKNATASVGTHIKISNRGDGRNGDNSLVVSMELNGVMYQGVLFAQSDSRTASSTATSNSNNAKPSRSMVS